MGRLSRNRTLDMSKDPDQLEREERAIEVTAAWVLRAGVILSSAVIVLGVILQAMRGQPPFALSAGLPRSLRTVFAAAFAGESLSIIQVGVLLLIATPWLRVILSLVQFVKAGDRVYTIVSLVLLATM